MYYGMLVLCFWFFSCSWILCAIQTVWYLIYLYRVIYHVWRGTFELFPAKMRTTFYLFGIITFVSIFNSIDPAGLLGVFSFFVSSMFGLLFTVSLYLCLSFWVRSTIFEYFSVESEHVYLELCNPVLKLIEFLLPALLLVSLIIGYSTSSSYALSIIKVPLGFSSLLMATFLSVFIVSLYQQSRSIQNSLNSEFLPEISATEYTALEDSAEKSIVVSKEETVSEFDNFRYARSGSLQISPVTPSGFVLEKAPPKWNLSSIKEDEPSIDSKPIYSKAKRDHILRSRNSSFRYFFIALIGTVCAISIGLFLVITGIDDIIYRDGYFLEPTNDTYPFSSFAFGFIRYFLILFGLYSAPIYLPIYDPSIYK